MAWLLMLKIKYWLGWLLRPLCWSPEFCCASCGSGASAMCSTRVRRPQARGECSHLDVWKELKWSCSCFWWSFVLVGSSLRWSLASFPLLLWLLRPWRRFLALPWRPCWQNRFETWAKGWMWNRMLCSVPPTNPILLVFKHWSNGSTDIFQSLWHAWMLKWKKMYWNVGWHMLRLNPGTVLMKVFVQTWAFLGCICLVSHMNALGTLRKGARALLAKKRMSDPLQERVSFQSMEQQQFEWKQHAVNIFVYIYIYTHIFTWLLFCFCFTPCSEQNNQSFAFLRGGGVFR